jgi:hypothetical protein
MDKGIGFNRNIKLEWLDATAAFCAEMADPLAIRQRLEPILAQEIGSAVNVRKSIDILLNIWFRHSGQRLPLQEQALHFFQESLTLSDRLWLHYGMTLLAYPFFCQTVAVIGQLCRYEELIAATAVREKLFGAYGELGSIKEAAARVIYSLRDWGVLNNAPGRAVYAPHYRHFQASDVGLESWLLACALRAHPVEQLPFADLLHLPALFPFKFSVTVHDLRQTPGFEVQRQGAGLDMVRVV